MCSVSRLARLSAMLIDAPEGGRASPGCGSANRAAGPQSLSHTPFVIQRAGLGCGGLARVDSLGLVVRIKRHDEDGACSGG